MVRSNCLLSIVSIFFVVAVHFVVVLSDDASAPRPILRYLFSRESCEEGVFTDTLPDGTSSYPPLQRDVSATQCGVGSGIRSSPIEPSDSLEHSRLSMSADATKDVLQQIKESKQGISFEFWLKAAENGTDQMSTIFAIGSIDEQSSNRGQNICDRDNFDLHLAGFGSFFQVTFRNNVAYYPCFRFPAHKSTSDPGEVLHLVITLRDNHQQIFINGQGGYIAKQPFSGSLENWSPSNIMSFFSPPGQSTSNVWDGHLYQFSIYDSALSSPQITESLRRGLPPGKAYAFPYETTLNEDAEAVPGSHSQNWYISSPDPMDDNVVGDLQRMTLKARSMIDELEDLLHSVNLTSQFLSTSLPPTYFFITGLPAKGRLFHRIRNTTLELLRPRGRNNKDSFAIPIGDPTSLIYLPPLNEYSDEPEMEFTQIMYCVSDEYIFDPAQCESSPISIVIDPVNDPPRAMNNPGILDTWEGPESITLPSIELFGSDVDSGDSAVSLEITETPRWGKLILRVTSFREDGLPNGTPIAGPGTTLLATEGKPIYLKYVTDRAVENSQMQVIPGNGATDFFRFRVSDQHGVWSTIKTVQVQIASKLTVVKPELLDLAIEGPNPVITLNGTDDSGYNRSNAFFIESLPLEQWGFLTNEESGELLKSRAIIPITTNSVAKVRFQSPPYACRSTDMMPPLNFSYRLVAIEQNRVVSSSSLAVQDILRDCQKPEVIQLSVPNRALSVSSFDLGSATNSECRDVIYSDDVEMPASFSCDAATKLEGIQVRVSQNYSNLVFVTVLPGNGFITFTRESWSAVNPIKGRSVLSSKNVTFSVHPTDLHKIFQGMSFRSRTRGKDFIEITIRYGDCSNVKKSDGCYAVTKMMEVGVAEGGTQHTVYHPVRLGFPWQVLICWIGYPVLYCIFSVWTDATDAGKAKVQRMLSDSPV